MTQSEFILQKIAAYEAAPEDSREQWLAFRSLEAARDDQECDDPRFREGYGMTEHPARLTDEAREALNDFFSKH